VHAYFGVLLMQVNLLGLVKPLRTYSMGSEISFDNL
jgi:hypothetical protein